MCSGSKEVQKGLLSVIKAPVTLTCAVVKSDGPSQEIRHHADELICCIYVTGPQITWSEIMSSDLLICLLAPPLKS